MFSNVLVGVDEQDGGRDAITLAKHLVADGGEVTLGYIYQGDPHVWRGSSPPFDAAERERAHELLGSLSQASGIDAHTRSRGSASVGRGLHELAEEIGADLLVVGSSRRSLFGRVLIGDDTRSALNGAPCSVAIAPVGYTHEPGLIREIGVGYNGSPESEHALRVARRIAAATGAKLSAFEAVTVPVYAVGAAAASGGEWIELLLEEARKNVSELDGVEPHAVYGEAAQELALFSASVNLLIVGSRGYGPVGRLLHGSTSQQLARLARCPLLVLTRAARDAEIPEGLEGFETTAVGARRPSES